ncbi:uncharacterized protein PAC_06587 [Phialocephala subalpina]|uniref:Uncharacterized protein n=1 Tax=Phialocephala subalpina TaxID=576137 RepID=A0A1L7WVA2_9HELO|nr:uncharacterized protein PAC_06587 [Phialocephala subalpina]
MYLTTLNCLRFLNDREIVQGPKIHQDFTMVAIIPAVTALAHILFLLYIYPSPSAWQPLYTSLPTYPNVTFDLIINPASGPGSATYPDANYNAAISKLHTYPNANLLGYAHTTPATRNLTDVERDVKQYANWAKYTASNIKMHGIFFNEAPSAYSTKAYTYCTCQVLLHMRDLSTYIIAFEDYASAFTSTSITQISSQYRKQAVFILHDLNVTMMNQASVVKKFEGYGVGGVFVSTVEYGGFSGLWGQFVKSMAGG